MTCLAAALAYPANAIAQTQNLNLVWDATTSPGVSGYYVYVGTASGNYNVLSQAMVPVGQTAYVFQATPGVKYFFAVSAFTTSGLEGSKSIEIVGGIPSFPQPADQTTVVGTGIAGLPLLATDPDGGALQYSASGLPPGLTLGAAGLITGTPTAPGSYAVTAAVTDGTSRVSRSFAWTVLPSVPSAQFGAEESSNVIRPHAPGDFDGDGRSDPAVYRASNGVWYIRHSSNDYSGYSAHPFGVSTDVAVPGDYDGDGRADIAVYRPSTGYWYILSSGTEFTNYSARQWGVSTDMPVQGDFDGDGKSDPAVYRPSTGVWYALLSGQNYTTYIAQQWGVSTDVPVTGDYDGDGKTDLGVYRPEAGYWYVLLSGSNYTNHLARHWGLPSDRPVSGDIDGDGKSDLGVYRPSTGFWYLLTSSSNFTTYFQRQWGVSTDLAVGGDYDGDGKMDLSVYRPTNGHWYMLESSTGYTTYIDQQWGVSTDTPVLQQPR